MALNKLKRVDMPLNNQTYFFLNGLENIIPLLVFNRNHFEMRLLNLRINFYLLRTFCPHLGIFFCVCVVSSFTTFHLWPSSGDLPRPRIGY